MFLGRIPKDPKDFLIFSLIFKKKCNLQKKCAQKYVANIRIISKTTDKWIYTVINGQTWHYQKNKIIIKT